MGLYKIDIVSPINIYGRKATELVNIANGMETEIFIQSCNKQVRLKSLLGVLSLGIRIGDKITFLFDCDINNATEHYSKLMAVLGGDAIV